MHTSREQNLSEHMFENKKRLNVGVKKTINHSQQNVVRWVGVVLHGSDEVGSEGVKCVAGCSKGPSTNRSEKKI